MIYSVVLLFIFSTLTVGTVANGTRSLRKFAIFPMFITFVLLYLFVGDDIAQDRDAYYQWYLSSANALTRPDARDKVFSFLLTLLPDGLSIGAFRVWFASLFFLLIAGLFFQIGKKRLTTWDAIPPAAVAIVTDRLFMDLTINSSRSSIAGVIFGLGLVVRSRLTAALLWALAYGIHGRVVALFFVIFLMTMALERFPRLVYASLAAGFTAFFTRAILGISLIPQLALFDMIIEESESQSVARGFTATNLLSPSRAIQIGVAVILPIVLLWLGSREKEPVVHSLPAEAEKRRRRLEYFGYLSAAVGLLLYPDLALVQRLLILPVIFLHCWITPKRLLWLAILKSLVFAGFLIGRVEL